MKMNLGVQKWTMKKSENTRLEVEKSGGKSLDSQKAQGPTATHPRAQRPKDRETRFHPSHSLTLHFFFFLMSSLYIIVL